MQTVKQMISSFTRQRKQRRRAYAAFTTLAILVSITTMYTLSQPAATLAAEPTCGLEEHVHTDECYTLRLVCGLEEQTGDEVHVHDETCYVQRQELVCGQEEAEAHAHGEGCCGLICGQDEYEAHTHGEDCYTTVTESCGQDEYPAHTHGDGCYTTASTLTCGQAESDGHSHGDGCYDEEGVLTCGQPESDGHTHSDSCYEESTSLTCTEREGEGHTHTDGCTTQRTELTCAAQEGPGHTHSDSCYGLTCGLEETEGHAHTEDCYQTVDELACGKGHVHTDACYERVLICEKPEHTHSSLCYGEAEDVLLQEQGDMMIVLPEGAEVPEGYDAEYSYIAADNSFGVKVFAPEGALPEGAALVAELLEEESEAYTAAEAALQAMNEEQTEDENPGYDGFVGLDIRFVDAGGDEVEPTAPVYVCINALGLLPEDADPASVAVQHHAEITESALFGLRKTTETVVETVADSTEKTGAVEVVENAEDVTQDVMTAFAVDGFSTFTVTYSNKASISGTFVDTTGAEFDIPGDNHSFTVIKEWQDIKTLIENKGWATLIGTDGIAYEFIEARTARPPESGNWVELIRYKDGEIQYKTTETSKKELTYLYLIYNKSGPTIPVTFKYVDEKGNDLGTKTFNVPQNIWKNFDTYSATSNLGSNYQNYVFQEARLGAADGPTAAEIKYTPSEDGTGGTWTYNTTFGSDENLSWETGEPVVVLKYYNPNSTFRGVTPTGVIVNVFNYYGADRSTGINDGHSLLFRYSADDGPGYNSWTKENGGVYQGIVQSKLGTDGYPQLAVGSQESLAYLFNLQPDQTIYSYTQDNQTRTVYKKDVYQKADYLFLEKENGYYEYNSADNFAKLDENGDFELYRQASSKDAKFAPFNDINNIDKPGFHFGMTVTTDFNMPKDGLVQNQPMKFEFAGDDDVWVFIDDVLVLDMGGIHGSCSGYIDFSTGEVYIDRVNTINSNGDHVLASSSSQTLDLYTIMKAAKGEEWVNQNMVNVGDDAKPQWIFADYTTHSMNFYYLERGAGASNCKIRFNLPTIPKNSLIVGKELEAGNASSQLVDFVVGNLEYTFEVLKVVNGEVTSTSMFDLSNLPTYQIMENGQQIDDGTVEADGTFNLKAGQQAVFSGLLAANAGSYVVRETLPPNRSGQYLGAQYDVVGQGGTTSKETDSNTVENEFTTYTTEILTAEDETTTVIYKNRVDMNALSLLNITKVVQPGSTIEPETKFDIEVQVDGEKLPRGTKYQIVGDVKEYAVDNDNGIIQITAGQTIRLGILQGSTVAVREVDENGDYHITYTGTITKGSNSTDMVVTDHGVAGKVTETGSIVNVTVSNADYDFETHLPISKQLAGASSNDDKTFTFYVHKLTNTLEPDGDPYVVTMTTHGTATSTDTIYFGFKNSATVGDYYYRISEVLPNTADGIGYDTSSYIVQVTVSVGADGNKSAAVTAVTKFASQDATTDGTGVNDPANTTLAFVNSKSGSLSLTKVAQKNGQSLSGNFTFKISVPTADGTYSLYNGDDEPIWTVTFADGSITAVNGTEAEEITVASGETITIKGLPANQRATITETQNDGFAVRWSGDLADPSSANGSQVQTTEINGISAVEVTCTNTTGAALPSTGGVGTQIFTLMGTMMMLGAGVLLMLQRRRREGADAD